MAPLAGGSRAWALYRRGVGVPCLHGLGHAPHGCRYGHVDHAADGGLGRDRSRARAADVGGDDGGDDAAIGPAGDPGPYPLRRLRARRRVHRGISCGLGWIQRRGNSRALGTARGGPGLADDGERKRALERRCAGRRWPLPVHAIETRLSRPLPFAMGCGAQSLERYNRDARGLSPWRFLRRLLLGVDGAAVRRRRHESALDRGHCRLRHRREMGAGRGMV